jgi:hypothetical protein
MCSGVPLNVGNTTRIAISGKTPGITLDPADHHIRLHLYVKGEACGKTCRDGEEKGDKGVFQFAA